MSGTKSFRTEDFTRAALRVGLGAFLLFPYLLWIAEISDWEWPATEMWWAPLSAALWQATLSASLSLVTGFIFFRGLQAWRLKGLAEGALLLPNTIPPLFLVMGLLGLVTPWSPFPYGLAAVIFAHVLMNAGLVAIAVDRMVRARLGAMAETAWVLGVRPWAFWREVAWPLLRGEFLCLFLFVFGICFTSFSVPLLLSGERAVTLEVAIYDSIRIDGRWDQAVILAALQAAVLLALATLLPQPFWPSRPIRSCLGLLAWPKARVLVILPAALLVCGWGWGLSTGAAEGLEAFVWEALQGAILGSLALGLAVGVLHVLMFLAVAYCLPHARLNRFLNGYLAPSPALTGFGLLLVPVDAEWADFLRLVVALTLISFPLLYRWLGHAALSATSRQVTVARSLGADWRMILFEVVWPQAAPALLRASGLAAVWACGDFALSGMLLQSNSSLPLLIASLLDSYRLDQGALLLIPLVALALALYTFFVRVSRYVLG